jgi:hypothetical protein
MGNRNKVGFNMIKSTVLSESLGESDKYSFKYDRYRYVIAKYSHKNPETKHLFTPENRFLGFPRR